MTIEQLGALGEFVGALAVLASLVYVATQIRQNTMATRLATLQAAQDSAIGVMGDPARDAELARIISLAMAGSSDISEDERSRFFWWFTCCMRAVENYFVQHQAGVLDDQTWNARARAIEGVLLTPLGRELWQSFRHGYREDFGGWVSSVLEDDPEALPPAAQQGDEVGR